MRNTILLMLLCLIPFVGFSQSDFTTFKNDPLNLKETTLSNGLTVYLIEDHNKPEIFGGVAVKAGSKYDPADATGMAHYLEHMLFKGTTTLGTVDFAKEKVYLDKIDALYDQLGKTSDEAIRQDIQNQINENSVKATEYALPNEFSNLVNYMGGENLNAFTTEDMIFFFHSFPPNQMRRFLDLYAHRMDKPVFRLFQSELETVYEEKNQRSETFIAVILESFLKNAFKNHPYGTQTVIGTAEHLKSPSLTKMYNYFNTFFVANNMALVLSGDFDADAVMADIEKTFGVLPISKEVPKFDPPQELPFKGREVVEMAVSPIPLGVMGFRTVAVGHPDRAALEVTNHLLFNQGGTGYFNIAGTEQRIMAAFIFPFPVFDHGITILYFLPKTGEQSIEDAEKVVLAEMKRLHDGDFENWQMESAKRKLKMDFIQQMESNNARANLVARNFCSGQSWQSFVDQPAAYDAVSREKVIEMAKKYYGNDYLLIASNTGSPKKVKLNKPGYKAPIPKRETESEYAQYFKTLPEGKPVDRFVDFSKDFATIKVNDHVNLYHVTNPINSIFELEIKFGYGNRSSDLLSIASQYMNLVGTKKMNNETLRREMSSQGLTYTIYSGANALTISLSGYDENMTQGLSMLRDLVSKPEMDDSQVKNVGRGIMAQYQQELQDPQTVGSALYDYARFGENSSYLKRLSAAKASGRKAKELVAVFKTALKYDAEVHYSGKLSGEEVANQLRNNFFSKIKPSKAPAYVPMTKVKHTEPIVYFCERKDANQTQIYLFKEGSVWNPEMDIMAKAFTRYFGRGFSALVLQEIREYRSLAYNARASIRRPERKGQTTDFYGFVSTQTDKTNEALDVFMDLINDMPQKKNRMELIRRGMEQTAYASRPGFRNLTEWASNMMKMGYDTDPNRELANKSANMTWDQLYKFYQDEVQNPDRPLILAITGPSDRFDMDKIGKLGKIVKLGEADFMRN